MVSDYRTARSYIIFNYNDIGWTTYTDSVQGFQASRKRFTNIHTSLSSLAYKLPELQGNHGKPQSLKRNIVKYYNITNISLTQSVLKFYSLFNFIFT